MRKAYDTDLQDNRLWMSQLYFSDQDVAERKRRIRREGHSTQAARKATAKARPKAEELKILQQGLKDFKLNNETEK